MNGNVYKKRKPRSAEHAEKIRQSLKKAHAVGKFAAANNSVALKATWSSGAFRDRDQSYRDDPLYKKQVSEKLKKHWRDGIFDKARNNKISKAHKGKPKPWLQKEPLKRTCKLCAKNFLTKNKKQVFCSRSCATKHTAKNKVIDPKKEQLRRQKISESLKGRIPKNLKERIKANNSYRQNDMFVIIKEYFPDAIANYYVKTKNTKRWLDVAVPSRFIDFEYDGKVHLMKSVQENDKKRTTELEELGWKVIRFNRENFDTLRAVLEKLKVY